jgi:hypothetical protein
VVAEASIQIETSARPKLRAAKISPLRGTRLAASWPGRHELRRRRLAAGAPGWTCLRWEVLLSPRSACAAPHPVRRVCPGPSPAPSWGRRQLSGHPGFRAWGLAGGLLFAPRAPRKKCPLRWFARSECRPSQRATFLILVRARFEQPEPKGSSRLLPNPGGRNPRPRTQIRVSCSSCCCSETICGALRNLHGNVGVVESTGIERAACFLRRCPHKAFASGSGQARLRFGQQGH